MSFLYPNFLWALTALSIPIIIHLFNFRKTTRVYFSSNRFLRQVKESTTAKRKLKHYLILCSRLLFLFFLVIAFAQPIIPAREQLDAARYVVLYLDNSHSMSAQMEGKKRALDAGIGFSQEIVNLFPPDTRYKLITNDFAPSSNTFKTKTEVTDLLTQIRFSPVTRSFEEIKNRIRSGSSVQNPEIFLISDFQKSTLRLDQVQTADSTLRWHLVALSSATTSNVFIDSAYLQNPFAIGEEKNSLHIRVRNDGKKSVDQLNLKLTINNIQAATASVSIPAGAMAETNFDLTTGLTGLNKAHISFTDYPVSFDNDFYFTVNFTDKIRVVEIKNTSTPTVVERVFGNRQVFSYSGYSAGNFNYSLLDRADMVVVNGIDVLDASLGQALKNYLNGFGSLLFIPGEKPDLTSYRDFLGIATLSDAQWKDQLELDRPDFDNPFFENVFEERATSLVMPKARKIIDWGADRSAILRFRDNRPFLSLFQQSGKLYVMASPLDREFTDFFNHALFVPVMYRIAASGKQTGSQPYYTLEESFVALHIDSLTGEEPLRLVGEQEIVPSQRKVTDRVFLDIPKYSMVQGFYHVLAGTDTVDLLAFNLNKKESLLDQYSAAEVKDLLGNGDNISIFKAGSSEAFSKEIKDRYLGKPLWKYALIIALFFLLMEVLLIRFMR